MWVLSLLTLMKHSSSIECIGLGAVLHNDPTQHSTQAAGVGADTPLMPTGDTARQSLVGCPGAIGCACLDSRPLHLPQCVPVLATHKGTIGT